ncbi:hypothetical protein C3495_14580 (plasmid) [Clostridiaceae bacterium 14S0207]|nr:hypothetical protein C3495_14580 [Clostridiaceae bacterium 14S0207]
MYMSLHELILKCRGKDESSLLELIDRFKPIILKYKWDSKYIDMESELNLFLLELVEKIPIEKEKFKEDKYIISYIKTSLKNKYIEVNKKNYYKDKVNIDQILNLSCFYNDIDAIVMRTILRRLTPNERNIIILKFYKMYSDVEIAEMFNISRQAINRTKRRALKKLKDMLTIEDEISA